MVKNPAANAGNARNTGLIPGSRKSPGVGNGNPLQILAWKIPWTEAWRVAKSRTRLSACVCAHTCCTFEYLIILFAMVCFIYYNVTWLFIYLFFCILEQHFSFYYLGVGFAKVFLTVSTVSESTHEVFLRITYHEDVICRHRIGTGDRDALHPWLCPPRPQSSRKFFKYQLFFL